MTPLTSLSPLTTATAPTSPLPVETRTGDAFQALIDVLPFAPAGTAVATLPPTTVDVAARVTPEQDARAMLALFDGEAQADEKPDAAQSRERLPQTLAELLAPVVAANDASASTTLPPTALPTAAAPPPPASARLATPNPTVIDRRGLPPVATDQPLPLPTPLAAVPPTVAPTTAAPSANVPSAIVTLTEGGKGGASAATPTAPTPPASEEVKRLAPAPDAGRANGPLFPPLTTPSAIAAPSVFSVSAAPPPPSFADRQLDLASDTQWLDQLARDIVSAARPDQRLSFRLLPPNLGKLDVDLAGSDAGMSVRMSTPSHEARSIIAAAQPQLVSELRAQGIRIAETEVNLSDTGQRGQQGQQGQTGHQTNNRADQPVSALIEASIPATAHDDARDQTQPAGRFA